ncbi:MAG: HNH endonuclease [bacterium]
MPNSKEEYCYGCDKGRPLTKDHMIPQAIGGKLKVPICEKCRKKINSIDTELTKNFQKVATLLDVKRERKENKPFKVKQVETDIEFEIDSRTARRVRPKVEIKFDQNGVPIPDIRARSQKELNEILEGINKKYGQIAQSTEITTEPIRLGMVEYENTVGGRLFNRSVAKTAYLFLASRLPKEKVFSETFKSIRDFIFEDQGESLTSFNFIHTKFMNDGRGPLHRIAVHFDSQKRNIVGYVQYFGIFRFSVLIARAFSWDIFIPDLKYRLNPVTGDEIPLKSEFVLPDTTIEECLTPVQTTQFVYTEIEKGLRRIELYCESISKTTVELLEHQGT